MVKSFRYTYKRMYDPVHGFIRFDESEESLINSFLFVRLHNIHQLGGAYFVFPGAKHSRFEHSLGVMELASELYKRLSTFVRPDLFDLLPRKYSSEYIYWRHILRLASLSHDLGHLPFSHVAEEDLLGNYGHERWTLRILRSSFFKRIIDGMGNRFLKDLDDVIDDMIKISIGEEILRIIDPKRDYKFTNWDRILSKVIIGDFFGADRIDYLLRDSKFTGVAYGLFDYKQLMEMLRILPMDGKDKTLEIGVDENGIESCEALIVARHFMYKRVYNYSSVLSYNFHLKRFMRGFYRERDLLSSIESYLSVSDVDILSEVEKAYRDRKHYGHLDAAALIERRGKFKAISISDKISENDLEAFKKKRGISDNKMEWKIEKGEDIIDLTFPVVKNQLIIKRKESFSKFLGISKKNSWVYISPEHEEAFLEAFSDV